MSTSASSQRTPLSPPVANKEDLMALRAKAEEAQYTNILMELTLDSLTMQYVSPSWQQVLG
jgi:hypothetical protein